MQPRKRLQWSLCVTIPFSPSSSGGYGPHCPWLHRPDQSASHTQPWTTSSLRHKGHKGDTFFSLANGLWQPCFCASCPIKSTPLSPFVVHSADQIFTRDHLELQSGVLSRPRTLGLWQHVRAPQHLGFPLDCSLDGLINRWKCLGAGGIRLPRVAGWGWGVGGQGAVRLAVAHPESEHGASLLNSSEGHRVPS